MTSTQPNPATSLDIEDDMDDFDDILDEFKSDPTPDPVKITAPTLSASAGPSPPEAPPKPGPNENFDTDDEDWQKPLSDDFARDLAEGMAALLVSMKDADEGEFKKNLEQMMATETDPCSLDILQALGAPTEANQPSIAAALDSQAGPSNTNSANDTTQNFQDAIRSTMDKLKESDHSAKADTEPSSDEHLAALFEKMMASEGGMPDESELQTLLQGFMEDLMSKEVMYEPLREINQKYPGWLAEHRETLSKVDLDRYQTQSEIVAAVVREFEDPAWDADEQANGAKFVERQQKVVALLTKMQDYGSPPQDILGELPPGFLGENGMPNPEQCTIS